MPQVNRQGQAQIVSTAIVSPGSGNGGRDVEATPWFRTSFFIDPQPASISPTININIVFICAFLVDYGRTISHTPIENDSGATSDAKRRIRGTYSCPLLHCRCYIVVADFRTRADAIEAVKQVIAEVTAPSLVEEGCQIYHWSQGADDPMLFLLYMEWRENRVLKRTLPHRTSSTPKIV